MNVNESISAASRLTSASVISRIEATLEGIVDSLGNADGLAMPFSSRRRRSRPADRQQSFVKFPGASASEARKFG